MNKKKMVDAVFGTLAIIVVISAVTVNLESTVSDSVTASVASIVNSNASSQEAQVAASNGASCGTPICVKAQYSQVYSNSSQHAELSLGSSKYIGTHYIYFQNIRTGQLISIQQINIPTVSAAFNLNIPSSVTPDTYLMLLTGPNGSYGASGNFVVSKTSIGCTASATGVTYPTSSVTIPAGGNVTFSVSGTVPRSATYSWILQSGSASLLSSPLQYVSGSSSSQSLTVKFSKSGSGQMVVFMTDNSVSGPGPQVATCSVTVK